MLGRSTDWLDQVSVMLPFFFFFLIKVQLIYNAVPISAVSALLPDCYVAWGE